MNFLLYLPIILAQNETTPNGGGLNTILIMLLFIAAMYFLLIAPQRKKQKAHQQMIAQLKSGDEIMTNGGIYATITNIKSNRYVVKIAENTKIELNKAFIQSKISKEKST
jgi:preprotein translocase subunit YajC